jgi:hypothetical protein
MSGAAQQKFRTEFRAQIPPEYSGLVHALKMIAIGAVAIAVCVALLHRPITWLDWLMVPGVVVGWNFVEWSVHKHVLHYPRRNKIARALYQRHTLTHHQFFTNEEARFENHRDFSIVFFPVFALPAILVMSSPFALLAWAVLSANAALLVLASVAGIYILFEVMHFCAHAPENAFVRNAPLINTMRRHHIAHHNQRLMMERNMNFTLPLADWLMGTSDLDRGLLGTIFNGYSTRFVAARGERVLAEPEAYAATAGAKRDV